MNDVLLLRVLSLAVVALAVWRLNARFLARRYLTFSAGIHLNVLIGLGLGPFIYTLPFVSLEGERVPKDVVMSSAVPSLVWFLLGYLIVCWIESRRRVERAMFARIPFNHHEMTPMQFLILIGLVFVGVMGSRFGLATSGAGTLFIIFYMLFYPMIILSVLKVSPKQAISMLYCVVLLGSTFVLVFNSPWRSQLILWVLAVLIGLAYRLRLKRRYVLGSGVVFALFLFIVSPFLQVKKVRAGESDFNVVSALIQSQKIGLDERFEQSYGFLAARVNSVREFGFVNHALAARLTDLRRGETYKEMVLQLIPRVIWPNKPVYNFTSGYLIAREIMLLGWEDNWTSAALTFWPEATINFGPAFLLIFVPVVFLVSTWVDIYSRRLIREGAGNWLLDCTLFFLAFSLVSVVQLSTMLLWTVIVIFLYSKIFLTAHRFLPGPVGGLGGNVTASLLISPSPARGKARSAGGDKPSVRSAAAKSSRL